MTITSSSDVWNFLWAKGGITAGRKNADHAIFQYGTADRIADYKYTTGSYTAIQVELQRSDSVGAFWQVFAGDRGGRYPGGWCAVQPVQKYQRLQGDF